ncbi:MAG: hypothetical protein HXX11_00515 [Desulfuromonadales bacterium]|nr:hypothetical protein [Desulfuromonadales bacterium]
MPQHKLNRHYPPAVSAYLKKRAILEPWRLRETPGHAYHSAVVIPALAEHANLHHTLRSLSANPPVLLGQTLILVVVNQRCDASPAERADNLATLASLPSWRRDYGLEHLQWVDAASAGCELPPKQGVGLARKIGLDLALTHLEYGDDDPLLICLDADTLVQPDYLGALENHFSDSCGGGASIPFRHRPAEDPPGQAAIDRYELFLRVYVLGMQLAGSPYAFHTVGSAMACRASAYVASGGMNRRLAGEDFYFLQQLHKTSGVAPLVGTIVHPSPRSSHRVPFGTGRAVGDMLAKGGGQLLFYQPLLFGIAGEWLKCVSEHDGADGSRLLQRAGAISPHLGTYLETAGFVAAWDNLLRHNPDQQRLLASFHGWFDAFRTMRLMHHLTDCAFPRIPAEAAVLPLLERAGLDSPHDLGGLLECMRTLQGV